MVNQSVGLSAPWEEYANELHKLFGEDPEIKMERTKDKLGVVMKVANTQKADALQKLLPVEVKFGNVTLTITVVPENFDVVNDTTFATAFKGNPVVNDIVALKEDVPFPMTYVVFRKEVVQFFNDDLSDLRGLKSTLFEDIAENIFEDVDHSGVCFCTDIK